MGRYDDDDSEYVAYGNMSSAGSAEDDDKKLKRFMKLFVDEYVQSKLTIDNRTTSDLDELANLLNKIAQNEEISADDKKFMIECGASETLLKPDVVYEDIKDLPEFKGLSDVIGTTEGWRSWEIGDKTPEQVKEEDIAFFSAHKQIVSEFYKAMEELAKQDNDKSLYLRLTMMTKYHKFENGFSRYEDPQHRLYFMKTYLSVYENSSVRSFLGHYSTDKDNEHYHCLSDLVTGIDPADAKDILQKGVLEEINTKYVGNYTRIGSKQKLLPYLMEVVKDDDCDCNLREDLIRVIAHWIEESHYSGRSRENCSMTYMQDGKSDVQYTEQEKFFYDYVDNTLLQRADLAVKNGDLKLLAKISTGILMRMDSMNPYTKELTDNQIEFYEKYAKILIKDRENIIPEAYLDHASEDNLKLVINGIKYNRKQYEYTDYFDKHQISRYDASDFAMLIKGGIRIDSSGEHYTSYMDKLPAALNEGFWINSAETKVETYKKVCGDIYDACLPPLDDEKKSKIREVGEKLLNKLKEEHPLEEADIDKLDNKTLLVLTYTGDVKGREIKIEKSGNKIDEILLQTGQLKLSAQTQVSRSPVSQYCDINEIWVDESLYGCKTNLLDRKLQRDAIKDVIDLINRGVNVSAKVERSNRDNQKFPISPFERYINGILYRGKSNVIAKLGEDMQRIAREINPNKLFVMNKIFGSLSFRTRQDERVKNIEKQVNQIVSQRTMSVLDNSGKGK